MGGSVVDFLPPVTVLSLTQGWLGGCFLAAVWCGLRARRHGHSAPVYASVGLLLGPGAVPLTWLATLEELTEKTDGTGLNPLEMQAEPVYSAVRFDQGVRQLRIGLIFGVGGGLVANFTQALTHLLPAIFQQTAEQYEAGLNPWAGVEMKIRILWTLMMLVAPTCCYLPFSKLARQQWNRAVVVQKVIHWPAWVIPAALLVFFALAFVAIAIGFHAYEFFLS